MNRHYTRRYQVNYWDIESKGWTFSSPCRARWHPLWPPQMVIVIRRKTCVSNLCRRSTETPIHSDTPAYSSLLHVVKFRNRYFRRGIKNEKRDLRILDLLPRYSTFLGLQDLLTTLASEGEINVTKWLDTKPVFYFKVKPQEMTSSIPRD